MEETSSHVGWPSGHRPAACLQIPELWARMPTPPTRGRVEIQNQGRFRIKPSRSSKHQYQNTNEENPFPARKDSGHAQPLRATSRLPRERTSRRINLPLDPSSTGPGKYPSSQIVPKSRFANGANSSDSRGKIRAPKTALLTYGRPSTTAFPTRTGKPLSPNNVLRRYVFPACHPLGLS